MTRLDPLGNVGVSYVELEWMEEVEDSRIQEFSSGLVGLDLSGDRDRVGDRSSMLEFVFSVSSLLLSSVG